MIGQWRTLVGIVIVGLTLTSCATIVNGQHQELAVTSQPEALCVSINGQSYGATPVIASLHRGHVYVVRVEQHGSPPYEISVVPVVSPWVWGNLVFGGLIGVVVDFSNDALYDLSPNRVHALFPGPQEQAHTMKPSECAAEEAVLEERQKQLTKGIASPSNLLKDSAIRHSAVN
ncbi:MAG: PEGA domain-containing protein [Nitrospira sp.]|jgi:hypothetical protein|nr:PEGA domain-containing protein [Nitrospira sp.]MDI3466162.1 hypothetical protein [Nitrospira sp.]